MSDMKTSGDLFGDGIDASPEQIIKNLENPDIRAKWGSILADLYDHAQAELVRHGEPRDRARELAAVIVRSLARYGGGRVMYLPQGDALERALRNNQIWAEFNGRNHDQLARKYRVSTIHVYRIIKEQQALHRRAMSPDLFDDQPPEEP